MFAINHNLRNRYLSIFSWRRICYIFSVCYPAACYLYVNKAFIACHIYNEAHRYDPIFRQYLPAVTGYDAGYKNDWQANNK